MREILMSFVEGTWFDDGLKRKAGSLLGTEDDVVGVKGKILLRECGLMLCYVVFKAGSLAW